MSADPVNASAATCRLDTKALSAAAVSGDDPLIGREIIGQYRIERRLGIGGMGAVYLAQQTTVSRPAVIKVLRSQLGGGSSEGTARFAVEAKAASSLNHPNIVTIYNYGAMEDGTLFLAMEYLEGETLAERIERCGQLSVERAVHIAAQIASALGEAHARSVVHRDLKPQNVMLVERAGEPDFVKVLDFGIAKIDDTGVTAAGYVVGTPRYMSPEQLLGKRLDCRSDVYSTAIVLYEMLAGKTPFSADTPFGWMHQHVDVEPKPPSVLAKGGQGKKISPPLDRAVLRALAKAPAGRPATMEEFARELEEAVRAPLPPPWWRRAAGRFAAYLLIFARFLVTVVLATASAAKRFARGVGLGTWRFVRAVCSGTIRFARAMGLGVGRFMRAVGSGIFRIGRSLAHALRSGVRRFVLMPPVHLGRLVRHIVRALVATKFRRFLVWITVVTALAITLAVLLPNTVNQLFAGTKPEITKTKNSKASQRTPVRVPSRDKKR